VLVNWLAVSGHSLEWRLWRLLALCRSSFSPRRMAAAVLAVWLGVLLTVLLGSSSVRADSISVVIGLALPPYVIAERDTGMELEIVREALALEGHTLVPSYVPFSRVLTMLQQGQADAAMTVNEDSGIVGVFYSDSHISYRNIAVSLAARNYPVTSVEDLGHYSVLAFQNARRYLGAEFAVMAANSARYQEVARQAKQITMLYAGRIDLIVLDENIFEYYRQLELRVPTDAGIRRHTLFEPVHFKVAFARESWCQDFNRGLAKLRDSGRYQQIVSRFVGLQPE